MRFLIGSTLVFLLMRSVALLPSKATLYFTLGLLPFAADLLPKRISLDITRRGVPVAMLVPASEAPDIDAEGALEHDMAVWAEMDRLAEEIGKRWPKGLSAADAISQDRR